MNQILILDDDMFNFFQFLKEYRRNNPDSSMDDLCDQKDEDGESIYSDEKINAIMDLWDVPASACLPASAITGTGAKLDELSAGFKRELASSEERSRAAMSSLESKLEEQAGKAEESASRHEKALADQLSSLRGMLESMRQPAPAAADPASQEEAGGSEEAGGDPASALQNAGLPPSAEDEAPKDPQGGDPDAAPDDEGASEPPSGTGANGAGSGTGGDAIPACGSGSDASAGKGSPEPAAPACDAAQGKEDEPCHGQEADPQKPMQDASADEGGVAGILSELKAVNSSLSSLRGDISSLKEEVGELSSAVRDFACVTPSPVQQDGGGKEARDDGSGAVIDGIVRETASSGMLASPLSILSSSLRAYRDSFSRRYAASMACLMAQDGEVNAKFNRSAELSMKIVSGNASDYRKGMAALSQGEAAQAGGKEESK